MSLFFSIVHLILIGIGMIPKEGYKFIQESKRIVDCRQAKCLLVTSPKNAPADWSKIKTINFLDGSVAFELYENN